MHNGSKLIFAMLKIRLARGGYKRNPCYRIVVADAKAPRDGKFIEKIGYYHPIKSIDDSTRMMFDIDRVQHWMARGAQPTERIVVLLIRFCAAKSFDAAFLKTHKAKLQAKIDVKKKING